MFEVTAEKTLWRDAGDLSMLDLEEGPIPSGEEAQMCADFGLGALRSGMRLITIKAEGANGEERGPPMHDRLR